MDKIDYKNTLNLPQTEFPMRANLPQKEPAALEKWESEKLYEKIRQQFKGKKKYILHLGPPYANGDIHIGHALTTILKDMIVKSKTLSGFDAPLVPGWDCHGLPIEINVEKKIGIANVDVPPSAFRLECREYVFTQIDLQKNSFKRLGIVADWDNPYMTMDYKYEANIVRAFGKILENGYLHAGAKPVHWCIQCGSSLAEAEVEYQNKESPAIDVCFRAVDTASFLMATVGKNQIAGIDNVAAVIWTTTPWTLPANQAVAFHPDLEYVLVKVNTTLDIQAICLLKDLMSECLKRYGIEEYEELGTFKGKQLDKQLLQHPFYDRVVPCVLGEHVTVDAGTGAVHTAPAHGLDDYLIGIQYNLPIESTVGNKGCFNENTPLVGGQFVFKANAVLIDILKEKKNLLHEAKLNHSYPHCWRHKTPIIFRATPQWFISLDYKELRQKTLSAINHINWIPNWGQSRIRGMIEGRPDWCISRQRTWGVPLPLLLHKETQAIHPQMKEIIEWVAKKVETKGVEAWYEFKLTDLPFENVQDYEKSKDILDVWFDSGVSHQAVLKNRPDLQFPADLYLEGSDQHRGWFQSSLLTSMCMNDEPPYKTVLTHVLPSTHKAVKCLSR